MVPGAFNKWFIKYKAGDRGTKRPLNIQTIVPSDEVWIFKTLSGQAHQV